MNIAVLVFVFLVVVGLLYAMVRRKKDAAPGQSAIDSRSPPVAPQGGGGPLNPEK